MFQEELKSTKQQILEGTFDYLKKDGLENASFRNICNHTGLSRGAITYYFASKDALLCAAAEYGLKKMSDDIFTYFFGNIYHIDHFFANCLKSIDYVTKELRFIYQMVASPIYGDMMRSSKNRFIYAYNEYSERLAKETSGDINEIKPIICIFAACVIDYVLWQDEAAVQLQLDYICKQLKYVIGKPTEKMSDSMDLLEQLKEKLCCQHISDLRYGKANVMARNLISEINLDNYTPFVLSNIAEYLYNYKGEFTTTEEAKEFFEGYAGKIAVNL